MLTAATRSLRTARCRADCHSKTAPIAFHVGSSVPQCLFAVRRSAFHRSYQLIRKGLVVQRSFSRTTVLDFEPSSQDFQDGVLQGLNRYPKRLPSKYFYDERGWRLFDQICKLEEYYPTITELAIMREYGAEMAEQIGAGVMLVEFGSGSSVKTRVLLDHLPDPVAYVPVDISREHLQHTGESTCDGLSTDRGVAGLRRISLRPLSCQSPSINRLMPPSIFLGPPSAIFSSQLPVRC